MTRSFESGGKEGYVNPRGGIASWARYRALATAHGARMHRLAEEFRAGKHDPT